MQGIRWEAPPHNGATKWQAVANEIMAKPGEWALIINEGKPQVAPKVFKGEQWERRYITKGGGFKLYVRYVG